MQSSSRWGAEQCVRVRGGCRHGWWDVAVGAAVSVGLREAAVRYGAVPYGMVWGGAVRCGAVRCPMSAQ